ncbi:MAG: preprotein translocase subunit SecE [Patescibacteria group bacterium]|nr:preprotein translocase subunit SecE [Patescibacteria group bacterium]MDD5490309.1 preprotein translocase subunit SecE [Patescibacteria group bacterium]
MGNKVVEYVKSAKTELKKVIWPTKKETTNYTMLVIGISLGVAIFLGALDYLFTLGVEILIK